MNCPNCGYHSCSKDGINTTVKGVIKYRFKCKKCDHKFQSTNSATIIPASTIFIKDVVAYHAIIARSAKSDKFVVTSVQPNANINLIFLAALELYCKTNASELLVVPTATMSEVPKEIEKYLIGANINLHPKLKLLGNIKLSASAVNPLSGLASMSMGDSIIIGHPQLQSTTLPVQAHDHPVIMTTTGTISDKNYSETKAGYKADLVHSLSAVVVELDGDIFHLRHISFDGECFYDLDKKYSAYDVEQNQTIDAIVTGDEHAIFSAPEVNRATYGEDGLVELLRPSYIVRHDVLDFSSASHHDKFNYINKFRKHITKTDNVLDELILTANYIFDTTPSYSTSVIIASNHNEHLTRWLNECDIRNEPWNALIYHKLMFDTLSSIKIGHSATPFDSFIKELNKNHCNIKFLKRSDSFKLHGIELAMHGDIGSNGSRGSREALSKLPYSSVIGHSHSPGISKNCWQVGTSSILQLDYNKGPSSWLNSHIIIHKNGKMQLINIIKGKWTI